MVLNSKKNRDVLHFDVLFEYRSTSISHISSTTSTQTNWSYIQPFNCCKSTSCASFCKRDFRLLRNIFLARVRREVLFVHLHPLTHASFVYVYFIYKCSVIPARSNQKNGSSLPESGRTSKSIFSENGRNHTLS